MRAAGTEARAMLRIVAALWLLTGCASRTVSGHLFEADLPDGWQASESPLSRSMRPLLDNLPRDAFTPVPVSLSDDQGHAIIMLEMSARRPEPRERAPQATLGLAFAAATRIPKAADAIAEITAPCSLVFERLQLPPGDARSVDYGGLPGCEFRSVAEDGPASLTMILLGEDGIVYVRCSRATPELDRACDRLLRSLRLRTPTR